MASAPPCTAGLDIGIVLDKSRSVKKRNLIIIIKFLGNLIKEFHPAPDADHFGFITFHNKATLEFDFANSKYHKKKALLSRIANEPVKLELETRTDLALKMARDKLFNTSRGDRSDKPNVMIVLTDGRPTKLSKDEFTNFAEDISNDFKVRRFNVVNLNGHSFGMAKGPPYTSSNENWSTEAGFDAEEGQDKNNWPEKLWNVESNDT